MTTESKRTLSAAGTIILLGLFSAPLAAEQGDFHLGVRLNIVTAGGEPANDILGGGLVGRYEMREGWSLGFGADYSPELDYERAPGVAGVVQDPDVPVIDAVATSTELKFWVEKAYPGSQGRWEWFWTAGGGIGMVDVDDVVGPTSDGGVFDVTTKADTELLLNFGLGVRRNLGAWSLETSLRADQHFSSWTSRDRVSGGVGTVGDYTAFGVHMGLSRRF